MARTSDPHAATIKAWQTRARNAGGGTAVQQRDDWAAAKVEFDGDAKSLQRLLPKIDAAGLRALAMADKRSRVRVSTDMRHGKPIVIIKADGGGVSSVRIVRDTPQGRVLRNVFMEISNPDLRGKGKGAKLFEAQVDAARKAGLRAISAGCARSGGMNGYYTWARLGFDGKAERNGRMIRVSNQMLTRARRQAWLRDGVGFEGTFSLKPGSYSMRTLDAYMEGRR